MPSLSMAAVLALGLFVGRLLSAEMGGEALAHQADRSASRFTTGQSDGAEEDTSDNWESAALDEDEDGEAELEELFILATAGDFTADDWDLSQNSEKAEPKEGTF
jgi:hypothetical protein